MLTGVLYARKFGQNATNSMARRMGTPEIKWLATPKNNKPAYGLTTSLQSTLLSFVCVSSVNQPQSGFLLDTN